MSSESCFISCSVNQRKGGFMHLLLVYWHFLKSVSVGARINKDPSGTFSFMDEESKQSETSFSAWYPEDCWLIILDGTAYLGGLGRTWPSYYFWLQPIQLGRLCHTVSGPLHMSLILSISFQLLLLELWFPKPKPPISSLHHLCMVLAFTNSLSTPCHSVMANFADVLLSRAGWGRILSQILRLSHQLY